MNPPQSHPMRERLSMSGEGKEGGQKGSGAAAALAAPVSRLEFYVVLGATLGVKAVPALVALVRW